MSQIEDMFAVHLHLAKIDGWVREFKFHPTRKWRSDFCWPEHKLFLEIEGGVFMQGRHNRGMGFTNDCEKYNEAVLMGWNVLRVTSAQVRSGQALAWVERALKIYVDKDD